MIMFASLKNDLNILNTLKDRESGRVRGKIEKRATLFGNSGIKCEK